MGYDRDAYQRNRADASFRVGFHAEVTGKVDEAIRRYHSAIACYPAHYESHLQLGRIYGKRGEQDKAAYHEEMARRSKLKLPLWGPARKDEVGTRTGVQTISRSVEPSKGEESCGISDDSVKEMLPLVWDAFFSRFDSLRDIQSKAAPAILSGRNAILISPTAGGKTEAVLAPLVQRLKAEAWDGLSMIYVSPTKALANDMRGRMENMLRPLGISPALRNGDSKELDIERPQEVLVTTPESLDSLVSHHPNVVKGVRAIVIDELHMIDGTYRGDQIRVLLRRVLSMAKNEVSIYASTATVSDPMAMARRYMLDPAVVRSAGGRGIDYRIVPSLEEAVKAFRAHDLRKCLIFCNTPEEVEALANGELRRWFPPGTIKVHHGKLLASKRQEAEYALKAEEKVVCVCTSTLEVGVDIGDIDMVLLASRPRSMASIAQRIGRGNRKDDRIRTVAVARGTGEAIYYEKVFEAIARSSYDSETYLFDPSVVVQQVLASSSGPLRPDDASVRSWFRGLIANDEIGKIIDALCEGNWINRTEQGYAAAPRARELGSKLFSNIPGSDSVAVVEMESGTPIGRVALPIDNIFVLGGEAWLVRSRRNDRVLVSRVERGTEIANFSSYDRFGAFFDLLPGDLKLRYKRSLGRDMNRAIVEEPRAHGSALWATT